MKKKLNKTDKKGKKTEWEWEETPEVTAALKRLHSDIRKAEAESDDYGVGK